MSLPVTSTYRFQLHKEFTLDDAREQLPYLRDLGISHAYCSPILAAVPGSQHGYDVLDHTRVNPEIGGREAFVSFADAAHELGMGVIVDVVPNHVAFVAPESANEPLWELLRTGADGPAAHWFDVDWAAGSGKLGIPILGEPLADVIAKGDLRLDSSGAEPVLRYFEHDFPLAPGTLDTGTDGEDIDLAELLEKQHYRLAYWRDRDTTLNYRRFFEVAELIAVRVEEDDVFDATHALLLELHHAGYIDGFRIDHPDGLADPGAYLDRLAGECRKDTPIWVEKILEPGEDLPSEWPCAGTTGYDAMAALTAALADDADVEVMEEVWQNALTDTDARDVETASEDAKRFVVGNGLVPEVERLTRRALEVRPDLNGARLREAVVEVLVAAPVYRAYLRPGERMTEQARAHFDEALDHAQESRPDLTTELSALTDMALVRPSGGKTELGKAYDAAADVAIRLQQTWGPVMAKSIEDTLFYRWNALTALNEVGGDPDVLADAGAHRLHTWARHNAEHWPLTMTTLSTHDTKRSEDVRAAVLTVAGDPEAWRECSGAAFALADAMGLDRGAAHLIWQTMLGFAGSSSASDNELALDRDRLHEYLTKALREAKVFTAWIDGDEAYERIVHAYADAVLDAPDAPRTGEAAASADPVQTLAAGLRAAVTAARERNADAITLTGHSQKALQLLMPGVPDTYQGSERPTLSLVDPDNRLPVDYAELRHLLDVPGSRARLVQRCLAADIRSAAEPGSGYEPLESDSEFVVAFMRTPTGLRRHLADAGRAVVDASLRLVGRSEGADDDDARPQGVAVVGVRAASRALRDGALATATVTLPPGTYRHAFSGQRLVVEDAPIALADLDPHEFGQVHVFVQEK